MQRFGIPLRPRANSRLFAPALLEARMMISQTILMGNRTLSSSFVFQQRPVTSPVPFHPIPWRHGESDEFELHVARTLNRDTRI